jgi:hypothetical protein
MRAVRHKRHPLVSVAEGQIVRQWRASLGYVQSYPLERAYKQKMCVFQVQETVA